MAASYDAIVIGAGHNGLSLALYLQRAGLSTLVLEQAAKVGGLSRTDEPLLPGYRHNPHANYLSYLELAPVAKDFGLEALGLRTVLPDVQHGVCFSDGRPPIVLHRRGLLDRTRGSIARYSVRDAQTYVGLKSRIDELGPLLADGLYAPAHRAWFTRQASVLRELVEPLGLGSGLGARSSRAVIDDLFESPEMRTLLYQASAEFGVRLDEIGGDLSFFGLILWLIGQWRLPIGGMQAIPDALHRAAKLSGVRTLTNARVRRVETRNGRVRGVFVNGLGHIRARKVVASSAGLAATLLGLLASDALSDGERQAVRAFAATPTSTLASLMFCLRAPPSYKSSKWDQDIDRCFHTVVGFDCPEDVLDHLADVGSGNLPAPAGAVRVNTLWDASQAPPGRHVAGGDVSMPDRESLSLQEWAAVQESFNVAFLEKWRAFAPNMTRANVLADRFEIPADYERKMRFREGAQQYRTEVAGVYICGSSTYPGGGVHGACAYNAYQAIAEDLDLPHPTRLHASPA